MLAEALFGFIDVDRNGKIEGGELKVGRGEGAELLVPPKSQRLSPTTNQSGALEGTSGRITVRLFAPGVLPVLLSTSSPSLGSSPQVMLAMLGFPAALLLPIPKAIGVDYRGILRALGGGQAKN